MQTTLTSATQTVIIGDEQPTRLIGERINPTGRKKLTAALVAGDLDVVRQEALAQVQAGADILDVNVGAAGVDDVAMLPRAIQAVMEVTDVPISVDTANPAALEAALKVYPGKALVNSVTGEERSLQVVLPLVARYDARVIGVTMDDDGIPVDDAARRLAVARKIIERAESLGIPRENVLIDCMALTVGTNPQAALVTLEAIRLAKAELGVNMSLGASNVSFGLPDREQINAAYLPLVLGAGVNCPIVNVAKVRSLVLATDVLIGRDEFSLNYIRHFRAQQQLAAQQT
jgi:5-methyltetrahydrofolate--homocysteine methyltransferase